VRIDILTLFPQMFQGPFSESIFQRAVNRKLVTVNIHNIRDYTHDKHRTVDDYTYGGGVGMVIKAEPVFEGRLFCQKIAGEMSGHSHLILICGRYEGIDERVREHLVTDEVSIGDYVLSGGELAAMVLADVIVRLLPGVLGSEESARDDSHTTGLLEYPQYTRPEIYQGWSVPEVLLSGNHAQIAHWRRQQAILRTLARRPELLDKASLGVEERTLVDKMKKS